MRKWMMAAAGLALLTAPGLARADSISPTSFSATLGVGGSTTVHKTVTVSAGTVATKADIFFLSDTTGSMGGTIAGVQAAASSILTSTAGLGDIAWGVGQYKDVGDIFTYNLDANITNVQATVTTAIGTWSASGGGDTPEDQLHALTLVANTTAWRTGSQKIVVWFGDAIGHDPASGGETQASTIAALQAQGVKVIAFDVGNLDGTGQATAITSATGGSYNVGLANPEADVVAAISAAFATYSSVCLDTSEAPAGVTASSTPCIVGAFDRSIDRTFDFDLTFTGNTPGVYTFPTIATVDGGNVAPESDTITVTGVPEPATLAILGLGVLGVGFVRRRRAA